MRVLMVFVPIPSASALHTMAPVMRQIESLRRLGIEVDVLEVKGPPKIKYVQAWRELQQQARAVDLIHAHYGYCGWIARAQIQKPVVVSFMGDDLLGTPDGNGRLTRLSRFVIRVDRWLARFVDAVIVKSTEMAAIVKPTIAHVIPNGIDFEAFRPLNRIEARATLGWTEGGRYILFPGDPEEPRKGFRLAQELVRHTEACLNQPLKLVVLKGIPPSKVPLYMNACDAMVMTSLLEGSPNVVKEAMACNLPVVSVPVGDVSELFTDSKGYVICARNAVALGSALAQLLTAQPYINGRAVLQRKGLDQESVARRIRLVYESVLANVPQSSGTTPALEQRNRE